ncbi:MAG: ParA family protein [Mycoplasma sp.]|nr:ParA family protein [Mycoplasma sp.]
MIFGIVNNKGGVLKTTISTNLAATLSIDNKKVIIMDLDGQGNVAATFGENPNNLKYTVMDFLKGECSLNDAIITAKNNINILPANDELNFFDLLVNSGTIKQSDLKLLINKLNQIYDYVIIDTPPNMSTVVATVLSIVDVTLIPFEPDQYAILGLKRIIDAAKEFIDKSNHNMKIIVIPTKVNTRVTIHNEIIEQAIRPKLTSQGVYVTKNFISSTTKSTASVGYERVPIVLSIIKSRYQDEYHAVKNEILDFLNNKSSNEDKTTDEEILFNNYGMNKL